MILPIGQTWGETPAGRRQRAAYETLAKHPTQENADAYVAACIAFMMSGYPHIKIEAARNHAQYLVRNAEGRKLP